MGARPQIPTTKLRTINFHDSYSFYICDYHARIVVEWRALYYTFCCNLVSSMMWNKNRMCKIFKWRPHSISDKTHTHMLSLSLSRWDTCSTFHRFRRLCYLFSYSTQNFNYKGMLEITKYLGLLFDYIHSFDVTRALFITSTKR